LSVIADLVGWVEELNPEPTILVCNTKASD